MGQHFLYLLTLIFISNAVAISPAQVPGEYASGCLSKNLVNVSSMMCTTDGGNTVDHRTQEKMQVGTICLQTCATNEKGIDRTLQRCDLSGDWELNIVGCQTRIDISRQSRVKRFPWLLVGAAVGGAIVGAAVACALFCKGETETVYVDNTDKNPPSLTCPRPTSEYYTADKGRRHKMVTWDLPVATDKECGKIESEAIRQTTGKAPGSEFPKGTHTITYLAQDCHSLADHCNFSFTVLVTECTRPSRPYYGSKTCSSDNPVWGDTCTFSCQSGYEVLGTAVQTCEADGKWSSDPVKCQKLKCHGLSYPNTTILNRCTDSYNYESACYFKCKDGLTLPTGGSPLLECEASQTWSGQVSDCEDVTRPEIHDCSKSIHGYADWAVDTAEATWTQPTASDNWDNSIDVRQTSGLTSGSEFPVGVHEITYSAKDSAGNEAVPCTFTVNIKKVECPPLPSRKYLDISCPGGLGYGSKCSFSCHNGYPLVGVEEVYCNRTAEDKPVGFWNWGENQAQSYCNETACPDLHTPINGALACDKWLLGSSCSMFCNADFDIPRTATAAKVWVCDTTAGTWSQGGNVPDCTATRSARQSYLPSEVHYFSGDCNDPEVQQNIASAFIDILSNSGFASLCTEYSNCTAGNVRVSCGDISNRKKRSADSRIRRNAPHTHIVEILFDFLIEFSNEAAADPVKLLDNLDATFKNIEQFIQTKIDDGSFALIITNFETAIDPDSLKTLGYAEIQCPFGTKPRYNTLTCAACPTGTYFSEANDDCIACEKGEYQDEDGQTQCKVCPDGTSTLIEGARHQDDCLNMCPPGFFSDTGLESCTACPADRFQQDRGQTSCDPCPPETFTDTTGSTSTEQCLGDERVCDSDPCHGHICIPQTSGFTCECRPGHTGVTCDDTVSKCVGHLCQNGATCQEVVEGYSCSCPEDFYGSLCQHEIVHGGWSSWVEPPCSVSCGGGTHIRTRSCDQPEPGYKGKGCEGEETEETSCNTNNCPVCGTLQTSYGNVLSCNGNSTHKNCTVSCRPGLQFESSPNPYYFCGPQTNWQWSHQLDNEDNTLPKCLTSRAAEKLKLTNEVEFPEAPCNAGEQEADKTTTSITTSLSSQLDGSSCLDTGACELSSSTQACNTNRRKRSTGLSLTLTVTSTIKNADFLGNGSVSEEEVSSRVKEYGNQLEGITRLAIVFKDLVQTDSLIIDIGGNLYTADRDTFRQSGDLVCSPGSEQKGLVCVLCLEGYFSSMGEQCEECPQHTYQDLEGQSDCKTCPTGTGTNFTVATNVTQCQDELAPGLPEKIPNDVNLGLILGCIFGGIFLLVFIIVAATLIYFKKYGKNYREKGVSPCPEENNANDKDLKLNYLYCQNDDEPTKLKKECSWCE